MLMMLFAGYYSALPWNVADDFYYTYHWKDGSTLTSLGDVISSQCYHYVDNNGRVVAHTLVQLYDGIWGQTAFAVCNAIVYLLFVAVLCKFLKIRFNQPSMIVLICCVLIVCLRTRMVASHQISYLWMPVLILGYCYIFFREERKPLKWWWLFLLIPFSVMAGNGQETFNIGLSGALICYAVMNYRRMTPIQWAMFFSFGIGLLLIILSPAVFNRIGGFEKQGLLNTILIWVTTLRMSYVLGALVVYKCVRHKAKFVELYRENAFWWNAFFFSVLFNLVLGIYGYRQLLGVELFASIIVLLMLQKQCTYKIKYTILIVFAVLTSLRVFAVNSVIAYFDGLYPRIERAYDESEAGVIYYDLLPQDVCAPSSINGEICYEIGGFYESIGEYLNKKHNLNKTLIIKPTLVEHPELLRCENYEVKCADGHWAFVVDKNNMPTAIRQKRYISLCGVQLPFKAKNVPMDKPVYENDSIVVFDYVESFDNITAGEVIWITSAK